MNELIKTVSVEVMRESDAWTIAHRISSRELMRRAGDGIFRAAKWKAPVGIVCGKGNNAGDGFVVASLLKDHGIDCEIVLLYDDAFSEDGRYFYDKCVEKGIPTVADGDYSRYKTILDCIFGTGFKGEVKEPAKSAIEKINSSGAYVVSADINSGLNGDTGETNLAVVSDLTVSVGSHKRGLIKALGGKYVKAVVAVDIGIPVLNKEDFFLTDEEWNEKGYPQDLRVYEDGAVYYR